MFKLFICLFIIGCGDYDPPPSRPMDRYIGKTIAGVDVFSWSIRSIDFQYIDISTQVVIEYWAYNCPKNDCWDIVGSVWGIHIKNGCPLILKINKQQIKASGVYYPSTYLIEVCDSEKQPVETTDLYIHEYFHHIGNVICINSNCNSDHDHVELYWDDVSELVKKQKKLKREL